MAEEITTSVLANHIGKAYEYKLNDEQTIMIKRLNIDHLPVYMEVASRMSDKGTEDPKKLLKVMTKEDFKAISDLIYAVMRLSLPFEDEEVLKQFCMEDYGELFPIIMEQNQPKVSHEQIKKAETLQRLRAQNETKSTD